MTLQDEDGDFLALCTQEEYFGFTLPFCALCIKQTTGCVQGAPVPTKEAGRFPLEERIKRRKRGESSPLALPVFVAPCYIC